MYTIIDGDGLLYQAAYNVPNVQKAYDKMVDKINDLCRVDFDQTGKFTMYVEGQGNWRKDIFDGYKASRGKARKADPNAELRKELTQHLIDVKLAIPAIGLESDDCVRRKAELMRSRGQPYIVCSADKDLDMVVGPHIRFNTKWDLQEYTITEEESDYNYFYQLMVGDMTDNIQHPKGLGPKTAKAILDDNPKEMWKYLVEEEYKNRCGHEWLHALTFTGSLIHIQRKGGELFNWRGNGTWFDLGFSGPPTCYNYTDRMMGK